MRQKKQERKVWKFHPREGVVFLLTYSNSRSWVPPLVVWLMFEQNIAARHEAMWLLADRLLCTGLAPCRGNPCFQSHSNRGRYSLSFLRHSGWQCDFGGTMTGGNRAPWPSGTLRRQKSCVDGFLLAATVRGRSEKSSNLLQRQFSVDQDMRHCQSNSIRDDSRNTEANFRNKKRQSTTNPENVPKYEWVFLICNTFNFHQKKIETS